ncbi:MAG TPA: HEAT repeat domain-containing protein [Gemmatales bacterium]|nr:HEAT repeat domain-containing protein [Gemmatales bacterium]
MSDWDRIIADLHNIEDMDCAIAACDALDKSADESWLPQLHQLLAHGRDFFVREAAAYPIARLEGLSALPRLLNGMQLGENDGHDNDGLSELVVDLISANPKEAEPTLIQMISSASERERSDAAWLWGFAAKTLASEPLMTALNDASPRVRAAAIGSLCSYQSRDDIFARLMQSLNDPDEEVLSSTVTALGYYGNKRAISRLRELLSNPSKQVNRRVIYAIEQLENDG